MDFDELTPAWREMELHQLTKLQVLLQLIFYVSKRKWCYKYKNRWKLQQERRLDTKKNGKEKEKSKKEKREREKKKENVSPTRCLTPEKKSSFLIGSPILFTYFPSLRNCAFLVSSYIFKLFHFSPPSPGCHILIGPQFRYFPSGCLLIGQDSTFQTLPLPPPSPKKKNLRRATFES